MVDNMATNDNNRALILFHSYRELFNKLNNEQLGKLMRVIFEYDITGEIIDIDDPIIDVAFTLIKQDVDHNKEKYEATCERNRSNGAKGGRPKRKTQNNPENPVGYLGFSNKPTETQNNRTDNLGFPEKPTETLYKEKDKEKYKDKEKDKENNRQPIFSLLENEFGRPLSPMEIETEQEWERLFPYELILEAIKRATASNIRTTAYISGILNNWSSRDIRTISQVFEADEKFHKDKDKPPQSESLRGFRGNQNNYEDNLYEI